MSFQGDRGNTGLEGLAGIAGSPGGEGPIGLTGSPGQRGDNVSFTNRNATNLEFNMLLYIRQSRIISIAKSFVSCLFACFEFRVAEAPLDPQDQLEYGEKW